MRSLLPKEGARPEVLRGWWWSTSDDGAVVGLEEDWEN